MAHAGACPNCLRRSWLLSLIAPYIEKALDPAKGELPFDLLRLDNGALVEAVAPNVASTVLARIGALREGHFSDALRLADAWATCRHDPFYPASLHELPAAPCALIGLGDPRLLVSFDWSETVTVVGARRATSYGREMGRALGADLAASDVTVVSGMDFGIDSYALRGAVDHAGRTIAVLPCSADIAYPASMRSLWRRIKETGLVISEFAPETTPWHWSISARNRIMAGLAGVTVVVEAREASGSLVTAKMARSLGNEVGAVPGARHLGRLRRHQRAPRQRRPDHSRRGGRPTPASRWRCRRGGPAGTGRRSIGHPPVGGRRHRPAGKRPLPMLARLRRASDSGIACHRGGLGKEIVMAKRRRRALTEEERAEKRATERELIETAIEQLRSSEGWQTWLRVRRHFHSYSFRNQVLIAFQHPGATRVAGFRRWLDLGYAVRKGERGISILAPCPPSKKKLREWREAGANPDDKPHTFFRLVKVFDRSQVHPLPYDPRGVADLEPPTIFQPIEGNGLARFLLPLQAFAASIGYSFVVEPTPPGVNGYCSPPDHKIAVQPVSERYSPNAQLKTGVHEVSHALLHVDDGEDDPKLRRDEEEVVVECVAYSICSSLGFDTSGFSVPYMASWGNGEEIGRYGELIDRLATRIEDALLPDHQSDAPSPQSAPEPIAA